MKIILTNEQETMALGAQLWAILPTQCLIFLKGDLGAGKTTLTRGFLRAGGYQGTVKSPTYTLVEEYQLDQRKIYHFDLYRLRDPEELEWMGMDDYLAEQAICFIEWPEQGGIMLPEPDLVIEIKVILEGREIKFDSHQKNLKDKFNLNWKNNDIVL
jgi:tRNA threonylcarbamoyladenosine biosynthesis protein TsaE